MVFENTTLRLAIFSNASCLKSCEQSRTVFRILFGPPDGLLSKSKVGLSAIAEKLKIASFQREKLASSKSNYVFPNLKSHHPK